MSQPKLAFYSIPFPRVRSYYDLIDTAVEYGLPAIEGYSHLELAQPDLEQAKRIRAYADEKGVVCCCFSLCVDIVSADATAQIENIKRYVDVASVLGSPFIHHTIAHTRDRALLTSPQREVLCQRGVAGVRAVYDYAAEKQIRAVYEDQGFLFNGVEGIGYLLDKVGRNIGLVADFGNIYQMDQTIEPFIRQYSDHIVHAHLKDMKPVSPEHTPHLPTWQGNQVAEVEIGTGTVNFEAAITLLREKGYDGYYALEYGAGRDDSPTVADALAHIRSWLA